MINEYKDLKSEKIELIQYPKGILAYSNGIIKEINNYEFTYSAKMEADSQGTPIFSKNSNKVIGIQKSTNLITLILQNLPPISQKILKKTKQKK